jgi:hypothetical protein
MLLRHYDADRSKSIAKAAALALHELARARALDAFRYELELGATRVRHVVGRYLHDLSPAILSQPRCQLARNPFSLRDSESR